MTMTRNILRRDGMRGLYRGIVPGFIKVLPAVSISHAVYEQTKLLMGM